MSAASVPLAPEGAIGLGTRPPREDKPTTAAATTTFTVQRATVGGRKTRAKLKVGICGEHGGEPSSVEFCHQIGLDYVSCSPFRVPVARLAAAQAVISEKSTKSDTR